MSAIAPQAPALLDPARFAALIEVIRREICRGAERRGAAYSRQAGPLLWLIRG